MMRQVFTFVVLLCASGLLFSPTTQAAGLKRFCRQSDRATTCIKRSTG